MAGHKDISRVSHLEVVELGRCRHPPGIAGAAPEPVEREIGHWVIDEAHCFSKWGQDFRPDYRYISRFIREFSGDDPPAPVICLTATAKPSVLRDILDHFDGRLGVQLQLINGGAFRDNLAFEVIETKQPPRAPRSAWPSTRCPARAASSAGCA